jgi:hypothetical protein
MDERLAGLMDPSKQRPAIAAKACRLRLPDPPLSSPIRGQLQSVFRAKYLAPLVRLALRAASNEGPNELEIMGASSQTLTGWIGRIAAIGLPAIRIIRA